MNGHDGQGATTQGSRSIPVRRMLAAAAITLLCAGVFDSPLSRPAIAQQHNVGDAHWRAVYSGFRYEIAILPAAAVGICMLIDFLVAWLVGRQAPVRSRHRVRVLINNS